MFLSGSTNTNSRFRVSFVDNCSFSCKYGYATDSQNREICECAKHVHKCPLLSACKRRCTYGYKRTRHGCFRCKCNVCPPHECSKKCIYGYLTDARGCRICGCKGRNLLLYVLILSELLCILILSNAN